MSPANVESHRKIKASVLARVASIHTYRLVPTSCQKQNIEPCWNCWPQQVRTDLCKCMHRMSNSVCFLLNSPMLLAFLHSQQILHGVRGNLKVLEVHMKDQMTHIYCSCHVWVGQLTGTYLVGSNLTLPPKSISAVPFTNVIKADHVRSLHLGVPVLACEGH